MRTRQEVGEAFDVVDLRAQPFHGFPRDPRVGGVVFEKYDTKPAYAARSWRQARLKRAFHRVCSWKLRRGSGYNRRGGRFGATLWYEKLHAFVNPTAQLLFFVCGQRLVLDMDFKVPLIDSNNVPRSTS